MKPKAKFCDLRAQNSVFFCYCTGLSVTNAALSLYQLVFMLSCSSSVWEIETGIVKRNRQILCLVINFNFHKLWKYRKRRCTFDQKKYDVQQLTSEVKDKDRLWSTRGRKDITAIFLRSHSDQREFLGTMKTIRLQGCLIMYDSDSPSTKQVGNSS